MISWLASAISSGKNRIIVLPAIYRNVRKQFTMPLLLKAASSCTIILPGRDEQGALRDLNDLSEALTAYDEAIDIYRTLIAEGRAELRNDLAKALANKGLALEAQGNYESAFTHFNEAVTLLEECVHRDRQTQFAGMLEKMTRQQDSIRGKSSTFWRLVRRIRRAKKADGE